LVLVVIEIPPEKKNTALQSVWVQCDTKVSHICIFPSDGTNRIRFTGKDYRIHSQPDASGSPKTYALCDLKLLYRSRRESQEKRRRENPPSV